MLATLGPGKRSGGGPAPLYSMKMNVKLFGTISFAVPGYDAKTGITVELPEGATARDLIEHLDLPHKKTAFVTIDNRLAKPETPLMDGGIVRIIQPVSGG
jgi:sulfur carrier protein ThiS